MTLKVIHRLWTFSNAIRRIFVQHFTRFQLTVCSHGSSALAKLLVNSSVTAIIFQLTKRVARFLCTSRASCLIWVAKHILRLMRISRIHAKTKHLQAKVRLKCLMGIHLCVTVRDRELMPSSLVPRDADSSHVVSIVAIVEE